MKILSVRLSNVRRFTAPVAVEGIGDGLNVLCEPNETGKSTVFDALQALFFVPHRSQTKQVKALRPHAGGAPEVSVEIALPEGVYRIEKRWLSTQHARVWEAHRLVAQADEAEAWIARLVGASRDGGPSGLLWVRQGDTRFDPKDDGALEARKDLMSSVTGEVEAMTGGRRMDAVLRRCRAQLQDYVTDGGRAKAGGPLRAAEDAVSALEEERERLSTLAAALRHDLDRRRHVRRTLAELEDAAAVADRRARLDAAMVAHRAAEAHAGRVASAAGEVRMAALELERTEAELARIRLARDELASASAAAERAAAERGAATEARTIADAELAAAQHALDTAAASATTARRVLDAALRHEAAEAGARRRDELTARIARAEALRTAAEAAAAEAKIGPDAAAMRRLEALERELATARAAHDAAAADLTMDYAPGADGGVTLSGAPLPGGRRVPIPDGAVLELRGIGRLSIRPGQGVRDEAAIDAAASALGAALRKARAADMDAARAAAESRAAAAQRQRDAEAELRVVAPDGIDALRVDLAAIPVADLDTDLPSSREAEVTSRAAEGTHAAASAHREAAGARAARAATALARAEADEKSAIERLSRARAALRVGDAEAEPRLVADLAARRAALADATDHHDALVTDAPDLAGAAAALARARSVVEGAEADLKALREEHAALNAQITVRTDQAVEEELADTEARLAAAREALDRVRFEVAVLRRLVRALEAARGEARDRYFQPVIDELTPLLRLLWPEAELRFDDATLLPSALVRRGQAEDVDILSGGTQEQIAMMVRLAFARMLAKSGRVAPVILDDALVYTDDDRIEKMFDALHREADGLQILVLSCRQRAFRELGGRKLRLVAAEALQPAD